MPLVLDLVPPVVGLDLERLTLNVNTNFRRIVDEIARYLNVIVLQPGDLKPTARSTAPEGWLICDGSAVSRTTYADLFTAIGTTYGVGDGSTTFNLPNLKGRVAVGQDAAQTEFDVLGETGGDKTGFQSHNHTQNGHNHGQNDHNHTGTSDNTEPPNHTHAGTTNTTTFHNQDIIHYHGVGGDREMPGGAAFHGGFGVDHNHGFITAGISASIAHAHGVPQDLADILEATATNQTAGTASGNLPPYLVVNWLIKI